MKKLKYGVEVAYNNTPPTITTISEWETLDKADEAARWYYQRRDDMHRLRVIRLADNKVLREYGELQSEGGAR